jgi:DNA-binding MarR family transcriptional regulator
VSVINKNQRRILIEIANGATNKLTSKDMLERLSLNSSTIMQALQALEAKDYIEQHPDIGYQIIDPLFKYSLVRHYSNQLDY